MSKFNLVNRNWKAMLIAMTLLAIGLALFSHFGYFTTAEAINIFLVGALVLVTAVYARETVNMSRSSEKSSIAMEQQAKATLEQAEASKEMVTEMRQQRKRDFAFALNRAFYQNREFSEVRAAINKQGSLLEEEGGSFKREDIDDYLNFFEELGEHETKGDMDIEWVEENFGYYLLKAYQNAYVRKYVKRVQEEEQNEEYFAGFLDLARKVKEIRTQERELPIE